MRANAIFLLAMGIMLFLPAWTLSYWQAWVFWLLFAAATSLSTPYFLKHDPKVVERRMAAGPAAETEPTQKRIMTVTSLCLVALLVVPGIDHRLHWSDVPAALVLASDAAVMLGFIAICYVIRENSYAAATVRVEREQPVVSSGPYAIVRHPMYAGALLMFGVTPLALGSLWSLLLAIPLAAALAWRLLDEERFLKQNLPGYAAYCAQVRYRLVPGVW